jgi:hypothetical protein
MTHVMCSPFPRTFTLAPLVLLTMFSPTRGLKPQTWENRYMNTNGNQVGNNPCNTKMVVFCNVEHWTCDVRKHCMPYSISTWSFLDFNTSINVVHIFGKINIIRRPFNLHMASFSLGFNMWMKIIDMIMIMWIPFRSKNKSTFHLKAPKIFWFSMCAILIVRD